MKKKRSLTSRQNDVLIALSDREPITTKVLSQKAVMSLPNIRDLLLSLTEQGWVKMTIGTGRGRQTVVELSPEVVVSLDNSRFWLNGKERDTTEAIQTETTTVSVNKPFAAIYTDMYDKLGASPITALVDFYAFAFCDGTAPDSAYNEFRLLLKRNDANTIASAMMKTFINHITYLSKRGTGIDKPFPYMSRILYETSKPTSFVDAVSDDIF